MVSSSSPSTLNSSLRRLRLPGVEAAEWLALAWAVGLAAAVRLWYGPAVREDAYITLRYVRNLLDGQGFVYNAGEHVLGTTTPLFTLLLAAAGKLGLDPVSTSVVIGIVADLGVVMVLFFLGKRLGGWPVGMLAGTVYALMAPAVAYAVSGMETSLYTLTLMTTVMAYSAGRARAAAALAGICVWVRPDGLILVAVLLGWELWRRRTAGERGFTRWQGMALLFAGVLAPWTAFATWYFGSPVPQSLLAKTNLEVPDRWYSLHSFLWYFAELEDRRLVWLVPLAVAGVVLYAWRSRPMLLAAAWFSLYSVAYIAANRFVYNLYPFEWYYVPLLAPFALAAGAALGWLAGLSGRWRGGRILAVAILSLALISVYLPLLNVQRGYLEKVVRGREQLYVRLAERLGRSGISDEAVAALEIGALGYYYPGPVMDLNGLVSPQWATVSYATALQNGQPAWLATYADMLPEEIRTVPWFVEGYQPAVCLENWESRRAMLYRRAIGPPALPSPGPTFTLGATMRLLRFDQRVEQGDGPEATLRLTLHWEALRPMAERRKLFVHVLDADGKILAQQDAEPQGWARPTSTWQPGERIEDGYELRMPRESLGKARFLLVGAHLLEDATASYAWRSNTGVDICRYLRLPLSLGPTSAPQFEVGTTLGGFARLAGYDLARPADGSGRLGVTLHWQAVGQTDTDYTAFVHLLSRDEVLQAQQDNPPSRGRAPTSGWIAGEAMRDEYELELLPDLPPGEYLLEVGLYDPRSGARLPATDAGGQPVGDRVLLQPTVVLGSRRQ